MEAQRPILRQKAAWPVVIILIGILYVLLASGSGEVRLGLTLVGMGGMGLGVLAMLGLLVGRVEVLEARAGVSPDELAGAAGRLSSLLRALRYASLGVVLLVVIGACCALGYDSDRSSTSYITWVISLVVMGRLAAGLAILLRSLLSWLEGVGRVTAKLPGEPAMSIPVQGNDG